MICFAILAHNHEHVLTNQIENIKRFNPDCTIVLYNGGRNRQFAKKLDIPVCPYSRPLRYGKLGRFYYDIMRWLSESEIEYDYLVNLDSDMMFVKPGFEKYLDQVMKRHDCMGFRLRPVTSRRRRHPWLPARTMWREWRRWKPFFRTKYFYGTLNAMQVFRSNLVYKIIRNVNKARLLKLLRSSRVFALEEILYVTLAVRNKGRIRSYPSRAKRYIRLKKPLKTWEVIRARKTPHVYAVHPIRRTLRDPARYWITHSKKVPRRR